MTDYHVLNLGAGVQSTTLYLLSMEGRIRKFDAAIFADTQDETEATYKHLDWLLSLDGPRILVRTKGCLSAILMQGENSTRQRFTTIPAYTANFEGGEGGQTQRRCTSDYKVEVIERAIRRDLIGLLPRQRLPRDVTIHQYIGISWDERSRAADIEFKRFHGRKQWRVHFPLLTMNGEMQPGWTRSYCETVYLPPRVPHLVPRSACKFCPYHSDQEWQRLKDDPHEWTQILKIDSALREPGRMINRGLDQKLYLHASRRPLDELTFVNENQLSFAMECEGGCGL